ncbi:MAG: hypothetical protein JWN20_2306 [Jatrophihabitantaceae bacterium]|nr:hypothetical protein [Jatrophihabitantaceae bacterium]
MGIVPPAAALLLLIEGLIPANRKKIADNKALMTKARKWVGNEQYMALAAAAGVFASKPKAQDGTDTGDVNHMTGSEADTFITAAMSGVPHLKTYLEEAVAAGRKGDGFIAVLDDDDWNAVYPEEFPSEPVGSQEETTTNAFVSNVPWRVRRTPGPPRASSRASMSSPPRPPPAPRWTCCASPSATPATGPSMGPFCSGRRPSATTRTPRISRTRCAPRSPAGSGRPGTRGHPPPPYPSRSA